MREDIICISSLTMNVEALTKNTGQNGTNYCQFRSSWEVMKQSWWINEKVMTKSIEGQKQIIRNSFKKVWESHYKVIRNSWKNYEKSLESHEKLKRTIWERWKKLKKKTQENGEKVMRKSWEIIDNVMRKSPRKSWESHDKVIRKSW